MTTRTEVLNYIVQKYYAGNIEKVSSVYGFTKTQINSWLSGKRKPQKSTVEYLIQCAFVPEFKVIAEFVEFDPDKAIQTQLKTMLGEHANDPGIYAFYDSMGNLIYLGKATKLIAEITSAGIKFLFLPIVDESKIVSVAPTQMRSSIFMIKAS